MGRSGVVNDRGKTENKCVREMGGERSEKRKKNQVRSTSNDNGKTKEK